MTSKKPSLTILIVACVVASVAVAGSFAYRVRKNVKPETPNTASVTGGGAARRSPSPDDKSVARCSTGVPKPEERQRIESKFRDLLDDKFTPRPAGSVEIPVYVHIITSGDSSQGNVTDEVIDEQVKVLNDAFAGRESQAGIATPFFFTLKGIDRTANDHWFNMTYNENQPTASELEAKTNLNHPNKGSLNIYTVGLITRPFGWGRYPWEQSKEVDGIVIGYPTLPGGSAYDYNLGDSAVHETGHWLGLYHTFQGGCYGAGDEVDDTPAEAVPAFGCPDTDAPDTCPEIGGYDPTTNFMDYAYDQCMYEFTSDQVVRMDAMHFRWRT